MVGLASDEEDFAELHEMVRQDPETAWLTLKSFLCQSDPSPADPADPADSLKRTDLIEDLMGMHADAFIDRLERLVDSCLSMRRDIAMAHVGGTLVNPGLRRSMRCRTRCRSN